MELLEGINTRHSVRAFKATPIPEETLKKILLAASNSPSYTNSQPWEVAVVSGKKKEELSKILYGLAQAKAPANPDIPFPTTWPPGMDERSKENSARRFKALGVERGDEEKRREIRLQNFKFYGGPCVLYLLMDSTLTSWSIFDMGLFAQSLILAAHSFGVGTCLQAMLGNYPDAVRDFLGVPKTKKIILGISMGYPDPEAPVNAYRSSRIGLDAFAKWYS